VWHRAKDRADAGQASKRSPIGDPPHLGTSAVTARSAKAEIAESEYCSRFRSFVSICAHKKVEEQPANVKEVGKEKGFKLFQGDIAIQKLEGT